jgi:transcriptional regulator with XRE-family HTH domain
MINEELKQARLSQCISLRELEKLSGVGFSHIQKIEKGADASTSTIAKICRALGLKLTTTINELMTIKRDISKAINELNQSADKAWDDERFLEEVGMSIKDGAIELALLVGKWDATLCVVRVYPDRWRFKEVRGDMDKVKRAEEVTKDFMNNVVMPMITVERIETAISE